MSLINKMLQDLDARGSSPRASLQSSVKAVPLAQRALSPRSAIVIVIAVVLIALAAVALWRTLTRPSPAVPAPVSAGGAAPVVVPALPVAPPPALIADTVALAPRAAAAPAMPGAASAAGRPPLALKAEPELIHESARAPKAGAPSGRAGHVPEDAAAPVRAGLRKTEPAAGKRAATADNDAMAKTPAAAGATLTTGLETTAQQRAESAYRNALVTLQDGRVQESISALEQAVKLDPHHESARQVLVGLLLENKRTDEAISQLQLGLTLDARQPAMAMLLSRLHIQRGGSGIETLMRTLPYAAGDGDYHAFLAGALQREQRHREAIEQYQAALHVVPQHGIWLMGLGISLQAEKRMAEAAAAFQRARKSPNLTPELQSFVDRQLQSLAR